MWSFFTRWFPSYPPAYAAHRLQGPSNVASSGNYTTIATLKGVPAGDYAVVANVTLESSATFGADLQLVTDDGTTHLNVDRCNDGAVLAAGGGSARGHFTLEALVHLAKTASIWLEARGGPSSWTADYAKIIAVRVESASDNEVTS